MIINGRRSATDQTYITMVAGGKMTQAIPRRYDTLLRSWTKLLQPLIHVNIACDECFVVDPSLSAVVDHCSLTATQGWARLGRYTFGLYRYHFLFQESVGQNKLASCAVGSSREF